MAYTESKPLPWYAGKYSDVNSWCVVWRSNGRLNYLSFDQGIILTDLTSNAHVLGWQGKAEWTEGAPTVLFREECTVGSPGGPLDVRSDSNYAVLLIHGKPTACQWGDCEGSIGQNLVRATSSDVTSAINAFRESVSAPMGEHIELARHFSDVLRVLATGKYALILEDIPSDAYVVDLIHAPNDDVEITNFYPGYGALIATQPLNALSALHVENLYDEIQKGARPIVITLCADKSWGEFIIDGHHKISAYRKANLSIRRLNIIRLDSECMSLQKVWNFVPDVGDLRKNLKENWLG